MRKVVLIAMYFLFGVCIVSTINMLNIKENNHKIYNEIKGNNMNNQNLKKEITENEKQLENLKSEKKKEWEELSAWKNIEAKLEKATSN